MYIFIDTNNYLDYYKMSEDTIISLKKLRDYLIKNKGKVNLILPLQIEEEFYRRRNGIIKATLVRTKKLKEELDKLLAAHYKQDEAKEIKSQLEKLYKEQKDYLLNDKSEINQVINALFKLSQKYKDDGDIFNKAYRRLVKGNPPGKHGSIGDAIAWEIIISNCCKNDVYVISKDNDWADEIEDGQVKMFLLREWKKKSSKKIKLYKTIGAFLNAVAKEKVSEKIIEEEKSTSFISVPVTSAPYFVTTTSASAQPSSFSVSTSALEPGVWVSTTTPNVYFTTGSDSISSTPSFVTIQDDSWKIDSAKEKESNDKLSNGDKKQEE
jgi:ElaB/YqjD/DUF883 family membrane-anchored ribosome-binding protein